jgi:hypothetical protein
MELSFKLDRDKVTKNKVVYAAELGNPDNLKVTVTAK